MGPKYKEQSLFWEMTPNFEGNGRQFVISPFLGCFWNKFFWEWNGFESDRSLETVKARWYRYHGLRQRFPPLLSSSDILILCSPAHAHNPQRRSGPDMKYVSGSLANLDQKLSTQFKWKLTEKVAKREKFREKDRMWNYGLIPGLITRKKSRR